jgi:hypothetical protein
MNSPDLTIGLAVYNDERGIAAAIRKTNLETTKPLSPVLDAGLET